MSTPATPLNPVKSRTSRQRMPASIPEFTIQEKKSWPFRLVQFVSIAALGAAAMSFYDFAQSIVVPEPHNAKEQLARYKEQVEKLALERDQFSSTVNAAESKLNIERSAQKQLAAQVKVLESENMRLKEDLAFFDSLLPNATGAAGIAIRRLKIDQITPNQLRYRLLIMQGGKGEQLFVGSLQLAVTTVQGGKSVMINFPEATVLEQEKFKLSFRYYQRVEGLLTLPEGTTIKLVQARVLEKGQVRAQQSANL
jgi:hypothetical protein